MKNKLFEKLCKKDLLYEAWATVKTKNSSGGIDGMSIKDFDADSDKHLTEILVELKAGKWTPFPYMGISIPKKKNEKREIGLLSIKDKIVQTAIKILVEPRFERLFLSSSYGYRPGKGHNKAVKRTMQECQNKKRNWVVKLDIDNYFDSIDHDILAPRLHSLISDEEIVRLIMLCIKMGRVNKNMKWQEIKTGVPQGAVISPVISNFYLHPFDQFVQTLPCVYVRYADDFVMVCNTRDEADTLLERAGKFLSERLKLNLIGISQKGVTVKQQGKVVYQKPVGALSHKKGAQRCKGYCELYAELWLCHIIFESMAGSVESKAQSFRQHHSCQAIRQAAKKS